MFHTIVLKYNECKKPMIRRKITRTIGEGNRHRKNILATTLLRTLTRLNHCQYLYDGNEVHIYF